MQTLNTLTRQVYNYTKCLSLVLAVTMYVVQDSKCSVSQHMNFNVVSHILLK